MAVVRVLCLLMALVAAASAFQCSFFNSGSVLSQQATARATRGQLHMTKHVQYKGAKKHFKCRPKKSRPSDKNRTPTQYSAEVMANGRDFEGRPPMYEIIEEAKEETA